MATSYRATVELELVKQHRCVGCNCAFRYPMKRSAQAQGATPEQASEAARVQLGKDLESGVEPRPCPSCGIYQPEMVERARSDVYGVVAFLVHAAPGVLAVLAATDVLAWYTAAWAAAGPAAIALLIHLRAATLKPNANPEANRERAARDGDVKVVEQGGGMPSIVPGVGPLGQKRKLALGLFAAAMVALPSAELMRLGRGWPLNPEWVPGVIGPGDKATIHFPQQITTVGGYWSASGSARADAATFRVTSKADSWGGRIRTKSSSSSKTPWAQVHFADASGTTLPLQVDLDVRYPGMTGSRSFSNRSQKLTLRSEVKLAPAGAGELYRNLVWGGLGGGALAVIVLGIMLVGMKDDLGQRSEQVLLAKES